MPSSPLYDSSSKDVTAPVPIRTNVHVPDSMRPSAVAKELVIEVVVSPAGTIESSKLRQSAESVYDALVSRAVTDWRYKPATRAGVPVRYRMMVKVVIAPPGGTKGADPS